MKQGYYFFLWKVPTIEGYAIFFSIKTGTWLGNIFGVYHNLVYVMILKNPYKTINNKARVPIFPMEGAYQTGSLPHIFSILSLSVQAPGGI